MPRTPMNERTDIPGEVERGKTDHARRIQEIPTPLPNTQSLITHSPLLASPPLATLAPFLLLPLEIRLAIYALSISQPNKEFPILYNGSSFFYVRTLDEFDFEYEKMGSWGGTPSSLCPFYGWAPIAPPIYSWSPMYFTYGEGYGAHLQCYQPTGKRGTVLALLQTCRNIVEKSFNNEATEYAPYQSPNQTTAEQAFTLLSTLPHLQTLHIKWCRYPGSHRRRTELLVPLLLVTQLRKENFVVHAPWDWVPGVEELGVEGKELPFLIERGEELGWADDYGHPFSPDDRQGVDLEGWDL